VAPNRHLFALLLGIYARVNQVKIPRLNSYLEYLQRLRNADYVTLALVSCAEWKYSVHVFGAMSTPVQHNPCSTAGELDNSKSVRAALEGDLLRQFSGFVYRSGPIKRFDVMTLALENHPATLQVSVHLLVNQHEFTPNKSVSIHAKG
jgi:hypothetical protein